MSISLMFVTLLLAAGVLALEREENTFLRLVRGLVSRTGLLVEKVGARRRSVRWRCRSLMLAGIAPVRHARLGPLPALGARARAGRRSASPRWAWRSAALTREVRAASLLAFMLSLPIAFLALVPSGSVSAGLYDVIRVISALFPFKPTLEALERGAQRRRRPRRCRCSTWPILTLAFGADRARLSPAALRLTRTYH